MWAADESDHPCEQTHLQQTTHDLPSDLSQSDLIPREQHPSHPLQSCKLSVHEVYRVQSSKNKKKDKEIIIIIRQRGVI